MGINCEFWERVTPHLKGELFGKASHGKTYSTWCCDVEDEHESFKCPFTSVWKYIYASLNLFSILLWREWVLWEWQAPMKGRPRPYSGPFTCRPKIACDKQVFFHPQESLKAAQDPHPKAQKNRKASAARADARRSTVCAAWRLVRGGGAGRRWRRSGAQSVVWRAAMIAPRFPATWITVFPSNIPLCVSESEIHQNGPIVGVGRLA